MLLERDQFPFWYRTNPRLFVYFRYVNPFRSAIFPPYLQSQNFGSLS